MINIRENRGIYVPRKNQLYGKSICSSIIKRQAPAVLANHSPRTCIQVTTSDHPDWLESVHGKTLRLLISMDDPIKHTCHWPLAWRISISFTIHWHLFNNFSPFHSPVKEKGKQWRMKELAMVLYCEKNWPYPPSGSYGREAGWQMKRGWVLKFLKFSTS